MEALSEQVTKAASDDVPDLEALRNAAIEWAKHCLQTYDGKMLDRGLTVSRSIAQFLNDLEGRQS